MSNIQRVIERISRSHRDLTMDRGDIAEWCYEVVAEAGSYYEFEEVRGQRLEVENGQAKLPCNLYRLLRVRNSSAVDCGLIKYVHNGSCLNVQTGTTQVFVDALVFKVDENGDPLISDDLEAACYWYCLMKLLIDPFLQGTLPPAAYAKVEENYWFAVRKARASMRPVTRDDMDRITMLLHSMVTGRRYKD